MSYDCQRCSRTMAKHHTLDVWRCVNVNCGLFDMPHYESLTARGRTESAGPPSALPSATDQKGSARGRSRAKQMD